MQKAIQPSRNNNYSPRQSGTIQIHKKKKKSLEMKEVFSSQDYEEDVKYIVCKYTGFRKNLAFIILILE